MLRAQILVLLVGLACSLPMVGGAQEIVHVDGPGSATIDASRFVSATPFGAAWRVAATDDPRFAEMDFDDSSWPSIPAGTDRLLADFHAPNAFEGRSWTRIHLHIKRAIAPLGFRITVRNDCPFQVFANGNLLIAAKFAPEGPAYASPAWAFFPPQTNDLVIAIRFADPDKATLHYFQLEQIDVEPARTMGNEIDLGHYRLFENLALTPVALGLFFLSCATLSFVLWLAQREHTEYLWLWLYCAIRSLADFAIVPISNHWYTHAYQALALFVIMTFSADFSEIVLVQFVATLAGQGRSKAVRIVQAASLVWLVAVYFRNFRLNMMTAFAGSVLQLALIVFLLLGASRRGRRDCGLLLIPLVAEYVLEVAGQIQQTFFQSGGSFWRAHLGGVGVSLWDMGTFFEIGGITAVILYRFIRVSKDEEIAAGELEAARTVQQLLIPATAPATPGFTVESAYLPARKVGGDFFLVLPAAEGSDDKTLLAVMGDVSGKGLQAAMVVSTIIGGLRMQVSRKPAEVLEHLNRMLVGHVSGFVTCCAVLIDADGQMRIANAGNPAPYVDGVELATLPALPLGMMLDIHYEETSCLLRPGQQVTFVSDGVIEATNLKKELYGFDRTRDASARSAADIAEAATRFSSGAPQADDISVLTISYA